MNRSKKQPEEQETRVSPKRTEEKVRGLTAEDLIPSKAAPKRYALFQGLMVEGLLSFGERTEFELGRLNVLVGPNGSGKSNLIDCVRLLRSAPYDIQDAFNSSGFEEWLYKGSDQPSRSAFLQVTARIPELPGTLSHQIRLGPPINARAPLEEVISSAETDDEEPEQYFVGSRRSGATLSVPGSGKRRRDKKLRENEYDPFRSILSQIRDMSQYPEITRLSDLYGSVRIYSEWTFGRDSSLREAPPAGRSDATLSESMDNLPMALNSLEKTAAHEHIMQLLQELKETYRDYVTPLVFGRIGLELKEVPLSRPVPAKHLSDGTLRFLALASILLNNAPPPLICLEEPELGMHPDMIRMVAGMLVEASARTQLIITTHSEHLLTALQDDFDALFAFDAGVAGSIVRRFSQEEYKLWREEHTLGELWTSGELGGNRW